MEQPLEIIIKKLPENSKTEIIFNLCKIYGRVDDIKLIDYGKSAIV